MIMFSDCNAFGKAMHGTVSDPAFRVVPVTTGSAAAHPGQTRRPPGAWTWVIRFVLAQRGHPGLRRPGNPQGLGEPGAGHADSRIWLCLPVRWGAVVFNFCSAIAKHIAPPPITRLAIQSQPWRSAIRPARIRHPIPGRLSPPGCTRALAAGNAATTVQPCRPSASWSGCSWFSAGEHPHHRGQIGSQRRQPPIRGGAMRHLLRIRQRERLAGTRHRSAVAVASLRRPPCTGSSVLTPWRAA